MKSLCVCQGGRVRSVALRYLLTDTYKHDALACGVEKNSPDTLLMLCEWADIIFVLDKRILGLLPNLYSDKVKMIDVGPDKWGSETNSELRAILSSKLKELL